MNKKNSDTKEEDTEEQAAPEVSKNRDIWGTWNKPYDFTLTVIGYVLGIHNFWRFPYLCYKFGGAFFIPYLTAMFFVGIPTVFMELTIGQYFSVGPTEACKQMAPILTGVSYLLAFNSLVNCWIYTMMISWSRLYSSDAASCYKGWEMCNQKTYYNTIDCFTGGDDDRCEDVDVTNPDSNSTRKLFERAYKRHEDFIFYNYTCIPASVFCDVYGASYMAKNKSCSLPVYDQGGNIVKNETFSIFLRRNNAATEHFYGGVNGLQRRSQLMRKAGKYNPRNPKDYEKGLELIPNEDSRSGINLKLYSLTTWLLIAIFLYEGLLSVSVITYIFAIVPFVLLILFTVKALSLTQALTGIEELSSHRDILKDLSNPDVWAEAIIQVVGTTGIGNGVLMTLATFNKYQHKYLFDTFFTSFLMFFASGCASLICFCTIGHYIYYYRINVSFSEYIHLESKTSSIEFGYIVYTHFLTLIHEQRYSIIMFFFMITSFSTDSALRLVQMALDCLVEIVPSLRHRRFTALLGVCCLGFMAIFPLAKNGGLAVFVEYEYIILNFMSPFITLVQAAGFAWIYNASRIADNAEEMNTVSSKLFRWYFIGCIKVIAPLSLLYVLIVKAIRHQRTRFNNRETDVLTEALTWSGFIGVPVLILIGTVSWQLFKARKGNWRDLFKPMAVTARKANGKESSAATSQRSHILLPDLDLDIDVKGKDRRSRAVVKALDKWRQQKLERFKLVPNAPLKKQFLNPTPATSFLTSRRKSNRSRATSTANQPSQQQPPPTAAAIAVTSGYSHRDSVTRGTSEVSDVTTMLPPDLAKFSIMSSLQKIHSQARSQHSTDTQSFLQSMIRQDEEVIVTDTQEDKWKSCLLDILSYFERWPGRFDGDTNDEDSDDDED